MERRWASAGREEGFFPRLSQELSSESSGICHAGEDPHLPFLFPQSELFLFFSSNVISDCTEIIIIFNQEILHFKIINEPCYQTSF